MPVLFLLLVATLLNSVPNGPDAGKSAEALKTLRKARAEKPASLAARSYWLAVPPGQARLDSLLIARRDGQSIDITAAEKVSKVLIRLDDRLANLDQPIKITHAGKELFTGTPRRTVEVMLKTLAGRGDPKLMFAAEIAVEIPAGK